MVSNFTTISKDLYSIIRNIIYDLQGQLYQVRSNIPSYIQQVKNLSYLKVLGSLETEIEYTDCDTASLTMQNNLRHARDLDRGPSLTI